MGNVGVAEAKACRQTLARFCSALDPDAVAAMEVDGLLDELTAIEKLAVGARLRLARRVKDAPGWARSRAKSPAHHLARKAGTSIGAAKDALKTSERLGKLAETDRAVAGGELSGPQTEAVADAATADPEAEDRLLSKAKRSSLGELRDECGRTKAGADADLAARRERIRAERYCRTRSNPDGSGDLHWHCTNDEIAAFAATLDDFTDRRFETARTAGQHEDRDRYASDAMTDLARAATATGAAAPEQQDLFPVPAAPGPLVPTGRDVKLIFRIDWTAFARGWAAGGETVEVAGVGPVPVTLIDEIIRCGDPFLAAVVTKGVDVVTVAHLGRKTTAFQDTALQWRDPVCVREGCNNVARLEKDHRHDWAVTHFTATNGVDRLCDRDHQLKTVHGWALVEGTGKRPMVPPDDPRHPQHTHPKTGTG